MNDIYLKLGQNMKMFHIQVLILCCHLITYCYGTDTGSFYGASYIHVPLQDAKSTTDVHFRFKTKRSDSFLLLIAGRTDYCIIRLEFGKLKVRINLGAGESEVSTARGLKLDDLNWHEVTITRRDAEFVLVVDNIHITKEKLPGRFYELNIHYGLFLGGQGDFSELFLGHHDSLRGCLSDVEYNGVNILKKARDRSGAVEVQGVTWSCSPEFEADYNREISFVENGAFLSLPNPIARTGTRWEFGLKTSTSNCLLLYNSGLSSRADYVATEIVDGHLRLIVERGSGGAELISQNPISDGVWHSVAVTFNPTLLEMTVDGKTSSAQLIPAGNRYLDLDVGETLFIGGMELNKRAKALGQGIKSADVSMKGCLRNMSFDGKQTGFPDAKVTLGLLPDCVWEFPCNQQPCMNGAVCHQQGVESFRCECEHPPCIKPDYSERYKVFSKTSLPINLEIVKLVPVVAEEGKNSLITTDNIDVVLDYRKYGVRDSGLLFRILKPPDFGKISLHNWDKHGATRQVFTLLDISKDKVRYLHDGSENHHDKISLDLELSPESGFLLPGYLQGRHRFVLHVNITPVNDPPTLELGSGKVLRLAQGTRKIISKDLLNAEDPDSSTSDLVYTVLNQGGKSEERGHFERTKMPGIKLDTFTQKEINNDAIVFVHRGKEGNSRLALQVSDGIETSPPFFIRVSSFPLEIKLLNNTGITLTHKASVKITHDNLTFVTNSDDPTLDIRYDIVKLPQFGLVQRLMHVEGSEGSFSESPWQTVEHFTSQQIAREEIRYAHTTQTPSQDFFKFKVSVMQVKNPTEYDFRITFTKLLLEPVRIEEVYMNGTRDVTFTDHDLKYATKPLNTPKKSIIYKIIKSPKYGFLSLMTNKRRHLQDGDTFTQEDIERERLKYKLHRKAYSHIKDSLTFEVRALDAQSGPETLTITHVPTSKVKNDVQVTLEGLQVDEGGRQVLLPTHLDLRARDITSLLYNITSGPQFGRVEVMDKSLQNVLRKNSSYFTSEELLNERVYYVHDDSETRGDRFNFIALSSEEEDFQYVGEFHVSVILKNDNTPTRVIDKVFNVVKNGEKLLTGRDIKYQDADIDTKPADIVYTRRGIPNGGLYLAEQPTKPVFEFTQQDLDQGLIMFKHDGDEVGKIGLWITDGQYFANGVLEVRASPPYITLINNTNLVVQQGGKIPITTSHLSSETNLNVRSNEIIYKVVRPPEHGHLSSSPKEEPLKSFTEHQLEQGVVVYNHDGGSAVKDSFRFQLTANDLFTEGNLQIRIYPKSFWEDLIAKNKTLYVEESTSAIIGPSNLQVMHPDIAPTDIMYYIVQQPTYGSLEIESFTGTEDVKEDSRAVVKVFEQSTINNNQVHYIQEIANQTEDYIVMDVTNGISWVRNLELHIKVIPEFIYLVGGMIECFEGDFTQLPSLFFTAQNDYYSNKINEYQIVQKPDHGVVRLANNPEAPILKFTRQQLENGFVQYVHDGSETLEDELVVVGRAGEKESMPSKVKIKIKEVNDQKPFVVNNNGLELWDGSSAIITSLHLCVKDEDTPPQNITFTVTSVKAGHLALVSNANKPIQEFTQAQIDSDQILFIHKGGQYGRFQFQFSDGESTSEKVTFNISAKPVAIHLNNNNKLDIFPTLKKPITSEHLLAVTSDYTTSRGNSITYIVKKGPELGRILLENSSGSFKEVDRFTQADINETKVWYHHTKHFRNLHAQDSFGFDVLADFTNSLVEQIFKIDVSVSSGGLDQFLQIPPIQVKEGQSRSIKINTAKLTSFLETQVGLESPMIQVHLNKYPKFGQICYRTECNVTAFSQNQINMGDISYLHDDSDTLADQIGFSIFLEPGNVLLCNLTLQVNILPVNDQPFSIVTLSPHLTVVQGQKYVLSKQDLLTEDPDTPPSEIVYDIINGPSEGAVTLQRNNSEDSSSIGRFTQEDINAGRVSYLHSGAVQPTSFYFRVSDGKFNPTYTVFNIHVMPLTLNISSFKPVILQQCSSVAVLMAENIYVKTNGDVHSIKYNVTKNPRNGIIYLGDTPSSFFTQADLENKKVMYMQTLMTAPGDSFQLAGWIIETENPPKVDITVAIKPLIIIGVFSPVVGSKNRLGISVLDASPLAKVTNSNPVYELIKKPKLGRLKKIIRSSGERKNIKEKEITRFSHEELKSGVIYYVTRKTLNADEVQVSEDSMVLQLTASVFQPAKVDFSFKVRPEGNTTLTSSGAIPPPSRPGPKNPISHEAGIAVASPNIKSDYILLVGMIVGVLLLAIIVVILVRCRTIKREERKSNKQDLQGPLPLPRPPDDLMPSSGRIKTFTSSNGSTPNSMLQCKVIPLGPVDSIASSDLEINARYPYGMSDEPVEDWSSFDTSETGYPHRTNNPMLRRNQYWV